MQVKAVVTMWSLSQIIAENQELAPDLCHALPTGRSHLLRVARALCFGLRHPDQCLRSIDRPCLSLDAHLLLTLVHLSVLATVLLFATSDACPL